jgi:hypothetical protein
MSTVVGLLASASDAESAVNNLAEQGVAERVISVVLASEADARAIIADGGPLRGATADGLAARLSTLGVNDGQAYAQAVRAGAALIAVTASGGLATSVRETLAGYNAQRLQEV